MLTDERTLLSISRNEEARGSVELVWGEEVERELEEF
jgi:hypothetical protein